MPRGVCYPAVRPRAGGHCEQRALLQALVSVLHARPGVALPQPQIIPCLSDGDRAALLSAAAAPFSPDGLFELCDPPRILPTASMEGIVTIVGLKPETTYAVRLAALNGKGLGEISAASEFKTQPVRK